jgi:hypothetical protein
MALEMAIGGRDSFRQSRSDLQSTLRKWKGVVASEEGDLMAARFEFLQGRAVAELNDPENVSWFDAAIVESEVWDTFISGGFHPGKLGELAEKLDRASVLFSAAGDRSNVQFTADWAGWFRMLVNSSVPPPDLVDRILSHARRDASELSRGEEILMNQFPLKKDVFAWNYLWLIRLSQEIENSLKNTFKTPASLDGLARGALLLATPPNDFASLLQLELPGKLDVSTFESRTRLMDRIQIDLQKLQNTEMKVREYAAEVARQWVSSSAKRKEDVIQAIHPEKRRPQTDHRSTGGRR